MQNNIGKYMIIVDWGIYVHIASKRPLPKGEAEREVERITEDIADDIIRRDCRGGTPKVYMVRITIQLNPRDFIE